MSIEFADFEKTFHAAMVSGLVSRCSDEDAALDGLAVGLSVAVAVVRVQLYAGHEFGVVEFVVESAGDLVSVGSDDDSFCG